MALRTWQHGEGYSKGKTHKGHWLEWCWDNCAEEPMDHMHFYCEECDDSWRFVPPKFASKPRPADTRTRRINVHDYLRRVK